MYTCGQFANLLGTTIKTLRYYDNIHILCAVRQENGYRYYKEEQRHDFFRIQQLQLLGFTLNEIKEYKDTLTKNVLETKKEELLLQFQQTKEAFWILETMRNGSGNYAPFYEILYPKTILQTGSAAKELGVTKRTLRFYDTIGLVKPIRTKNGYRCYTGIQLDKIAYYRNLEIIGFTLEEMKQYGRSIPNQQFLEKEQKLMDQLKFLQKAMDSLEVLKQTLPLKKENYKEKKLSFR